MENLRGFVKDLGFVDKIEDSENDTIRITLSEEISASEFNELCFKEGIVLDHLVKRKESLEEQFLKLTKQ
jgi:ABC-2 type transport system ATP-binding protein